MVKYYDFAVTFAEVPDEVSLCINITNCQQQCPHCHSPYLREDIGADLNRDIQQLLNRHQDQITCVCFLGEGNDHKQLQNIINYVKNQNFKVCVYSGRDDADFYDYDNIDYYKTGSYKEEFGPLNKKTTNQRMYKKTGKQQWENITERFFPRSDL